MTENSAEKDKGFNKSQLVLTAGGGALALALLTASIASRVMASEQNLSGGTDRNDGGMMVDASSPIPPDNGDATSTPLVGTPAPTSTPTPSPSPRSTVTRVPASPDATASDNATSTPSDHTPTIPSFKTITPPAAPTVTATATSAPEGTLTPFPTATNTPDARITPVTPTPDRFGFKQYIPLVGHSFQFPDRTVRIVLRQYLPLAMNHKFLGGW